MRDESSWTRLKQGISQDLQRGWNQLNPARARVRDVWRSLSFPYKLLFVVVVIGFLAILARQGFSRDVLTFAALSQAPWLIGMGIGFVLVMVLFLLWRLPKRKAARLDLGLKEQFDVENETRKTWATIVGGMAVLFSLVFTWANLQVTQENLRITQEAASKSQDLTRQGQITDRFTKAIAQLGEHAPEKLAIRLGGIYALERIARDSERDYWPIMEVLTAYVREHAPWPPKSPKDMTPPQDNPSPRWRITPQHQPATDIQAVLTVLGRRTPIYAPLDPRFAHFLRRCENCGRVSDAKEVHHGRDLDHCQRTRR